MLKSVVAQFAAVKGTCPPRLKTAAAPEQPAHGEADQSASSKKPCKKSSSDKRGAAPRGSKRSAAQITTSTRATKRPRHEEDASLLPRAKHTPDNGARAATRGARGKAGAKAQPTQPLVARTTRSAAHPPKQAKRPTPKKHQPTPLTPVNGKNAAKTVAKNIAAKNVTKPVAKTPANGASAIHTTPQHNGITKPSPLARELRSLLRDLGGAQGPSPCPGPRRVVRPTFFNPSLQQPVVVLATGRRGSRTPSHGGEGSFAHASLGHLGLVGSPLPLPTGAGPLPGAPWSPEAPHGACAQVRVDLKHVWGSVLAPPRRRVGASQWQHALQVLCDTKHFVKDYGGTALPDWAEGRSSMARIVLSLRVEGSVLPPFLCGEAVLGEEEEVEGEKAGAPATPAALRKQQRRKHKWTRHKGAHRKVPVVGVVDHVTNDVASAHSSSVEGGFPPKLLAAAARDADVARGLRVRLRTEVPPLVLCVARTTRLGALLTAARRVLASMYPLLDGGVLSLAVPTDVVQGRTTRGGCTSTKRPAMVPRMMASKDPLPGEVLLGGPLLVDGTLNTAPWSPAWRFSGGGVAWVVCCSCGIFDDDGNHMVLCDGCGFWMHSRCEGLADEGAPPPRFVCARCRQQQAS